jgi:hypothetical protein
VAVPEPVAVAAEPAAEKKKRGPKPLAAMTPEERAAHDFKVAERKLKKQAEKSATSTPPRSVSPKEKSD